MARPSSSVDTISKNMTAEERAARAAAEQAALSGIKIRKSAEVKADPVATKEFNRVIKLLDAVGKNDAMYEAVINDYCMYKSDITRYRKYIVDAEKDLDAVYDIDDMESSERYQLKNKIRSEIASHDKQINTLQRKRFEIEKETGFTVSSALRNIPKKPATKTDLLGDILNK